VDNFFNHGTSFLFLRKDSEPLWFYYKQNIYQKKGFPSISCGSGKAESVTLWLPSKNFIFFSPTTGPSKRSLFGRKILFFLVGSYLLIYREFKLTLAQEAAPINPASLPRPAFSMEQQAKVAL
jgi:hypothetical protein